MLFSLTEDPTSRCRVCVAEPSLPDSLTSSHINLRKTIYLVFYKIRIEILI
jgi:hypothetical protein